VKPELIVGQRRYQDAVEAESPAATAEFTRQYWSHVECDNVKRYIISQRNVKTDRESHGPL